MNSCAPLGHSQYIVWSTSSDKGVLCLVGEKKKLKEMQFAISVFDKLIGNYF